MKASLAVGNSSPMMLLLFNGQTWQTSRLANEGLKPNFAGRGDRLVDISSPQPEIFGNEVAVMHGHEEPASRRIPVRTLADRLGLKTKIKIPKSEKRRLYTLKYRDLMDYLTKIGARTHDVEQLLKKIVCVIEVALDKAAEFGTRTQTILDRCIRMGKKAGAEIIIPNITS